MVGLKMLPSMISPVTVVPIDWKEKRRATGAIIVSHAHLTDTVSVASWPFDCKHAKDATTL